MLFQHFQNIVDKTGAADRIIQDRFCNLVLFEMLLKSDLQQIAI